MGIITRLNVRGETRATSNSPYDPIWADMFGAMPSFSGISVTPDSAIKCSAVFACIRVLSETIASLPLMVYQRTDDGGKISATSHPLYRILHDSPHPLLTSYEFREMQIGHLNLRGNCYAAKEFNGAGRLNKLIPLNPANMEVEISEDGQEVRYRYKRSGQKDVLYTPDDIWHVKGLSTDGYSGLSPIAIAREAIGLSLATEKYGSKLFSNNARPGGVLKHPGNITEAAAKRLKETWQAAHAGTDNAHKVAILEEGLEWEAIGFTNEDSQFLETRNFQVEDIARIFRVPSVLIGHPDKTMTYASAEQFFLSFVVHTIRPWLVKIEQSASKSLLSQRDQGKYFVEHKLDGLLRGDIKSRFEAYAIARQNKWMSANEVRRLENLNPIANGDSYENPNITVDKGADTQAPQK